MEPQAESATHRAFAVQCNNRAWDLLEQPTRSPEEDAQLLSLAGAAWFHWRQVGGALPDLRARHLLASVHAALGHTAQALFQAQAIADQAAAGVEGLTPFDQACVAEAMARALAHAGQAAAAARWSVRADEAAAALSPDDRPYFEQMRARP